MQHEHRRVGRGSVDLVESRHAPLGELELGPAADHTHPLRRRRARGLLLEHAQRVRERRHAVPTQLHVVVEPAADRMHVRVVETGNRRPAAKIDDFGLRGAMSHDLFIGSNRREPPVLDSDGLGERTALILSRNTAVQQNHIRRRYLLSPCCILRTDGTLPSMRLVSECLFASVPSR